MDSFKRILAVKLAGIGDVLTATPALRALRQSFPDAWIDLLVPPMASELMHDSPLVNGIIIFDKYQYDRPLDILKLRRLGGAFGLFKRLAGPGYDCAIIFHHLTTRWGALKFALLAFSTRAQRKVGLDNGRGWFLTDRVVDHGFGYMHEVEYWLAMAGKIGAKVDEPTLEATISPEDEASTKKLLEEANEWSSQRGPRIAIHPGSGEYSLARRWAPEGFAAVADALAEEYRAQVILVGGEREKEAVEEVVESMCSRPINLAGRMTLKQLAALLKGCHLFLGNDSGLVHLAKAVGIPAVAIFGPSNHRAWGPYGGERDKVVRLEMPCAPCLYRGHQVGLRQGCATRECMTEIQPEMVLEAARRILGSS